MAKKATSRSTNAAPMVVVRFELPHSDNLTDEERSQRARRGYVLELVRGGEISEARGAEILGLGRGTMMDLMASAGVPHARFATQDLEQERAVFDKHSH